MSLIGETAIITAAAIIAVAVISWLVIWVSGQIDRGDFEAFIWLLVVVAICATFIACFWIAGYYHVGG